MPCGAGSEAQQIWQTVSISIINTSKVAPSRRLPRAPRAPRAVRKRENAGGHTGEAVNSQVHAPGRNGPPLDRTRRSSLLHVHTRFGEPPCGERRAHGAAPITQRACRSSFHTILLHGTPREAAQPAFSHQPAKRKAHRLQEGRMAESHPSAPRERGNARAAMASATRHASDLTAL